MGTQHNWDNYKWDEAKEHQNRIKHGISFTAIYDFHWESADIRPSPRGGEMRYCSIGYIGRYVYTAIYTMRGTNCRVISLRRANSKEIENLC